MAPKFLLLCMFLAGAWRCSAASDVEDACNATRYHDICIRSLSPFSCTAKRDPVKWARAAVSVTLREAKAAAHHADWVKRRGGGTAVCDCVELFGDALDSLHSTLYALRNYSSSAWRSEDVVTWLSAAMTDEDTCLDGLREAGRQRRRAEEGIQALEDRTVNMTYMTSNALALVNKLASPN